MHPRISCFETASRYLVVSVAAVLSIFIVLSCIIAVSLEGAGAGAIAGAAAVSLAGALSLAVQAPRNTTAAIRARRFIFFLLVGTVIGLWNIDAHTIRCK